MTEIEKIQSKILMRMQEVLDNEQLQKLEFQSTPPRRRRQK